MTDVERDRLAIARIFGLPVYPFDPGVIRITPVHYDLSDKILVKVYPEKKRMVKG